jgi:hypothetical protein
MFFFVLASLLSWLVDLATLRLRSARDKELEILLLRRQLAVLQRAQARPVRPTRWEKLGLAVLAGKVRSLPAEARSRVRGASSSSARRPPCAGTGSWSAARGPSAVAGHRTGRRSPPSSMR